VRDPNNPFFEGGDVGEVDILIDVDDKFVQHCAELIDEACTLISATEQIWL
jgi:hypothetical protein